MIKHSRDFLIIKNILRKYNEIKSAVQYQYNDMIIFDVDSNDYNMLLSIEMIIDKLISNGTLTSKDKQIIDLFKDGYTYEEIGNIVGLSRQIVSKRLNKAIKKIEKIFKEE